MGHDYLQSIQRRLQLLQNDSLPSLERAVSEMELSRLREVVRDDLVLIDSDIEELELAAEDCALDSERLAALERVKTCRDAVEQVRARLRQATLTAKRRLGATRLSSQRQTLLGGPAAPVSAGPKGSGDDELMNATSDVTASLRRTMQLMQQELDRSLLSNQLLEQSTGAMSLATDQHTTFTGLLSASKTLITSMERADLIDRLLIMGALIFFALVCLYILKRRILDKGLRAAAVVGSILPKPKAGSAKVPGISTPLESAITSVVEAITSVTMQEASTSAAASLQDVPVRPAHLAGEL